MSRAVLLLLTAILARAQTTGARQSPTDLPALEQSVHAAVKAAPTSANWEKLGLVRHLRNQFAEAVLAFREALRLDPSRWTSHLFLGICLYRTNQFREALSSLQQADKLAGATAAGRDDVDYWLAATNVALKQPIRAIRSLERLLKRNPGHVEALELAVRIYTDLSTDLWNGVADQHFETPAGYEVHGHALESEGNRKGALEAFRRSLELGGKARPGPGLAIGRLLLLEGRAEDALAQLRQEMQLPGADPAAWGYAGLAALELGRHTEAAELLERAALWEHRNPDAPLALAQVYLLLGDTGKAADAARRAVTLQPASAAAREVLDTALRKAGKATEAAAEQPQSPPR